MDIRRITETYSVSPQIRPEDVPAAAEAGFVRIVCNRPDTEVDGDETSASIRTACEAAGLSFEVVPVSHSGLTMDLIDAHRAAVDEAGGPVLAYCRSGTRSCHIWALGRAGSMPVDEIVAAAGEGGYDLTPMRQTLEGAARMREG